ncbi:hypothetical protein LMH87_010768 [Akanthomyces muscarius]|uniref:Uncharacterized protein n=1 Tax=Akanthomyces muscarius TaxID=2231603 RepID=A0A9W8Q7W9_AKAMU|nr:hypothetical protein LMH87_010768 [Akanthomyces muscarius]KAJ4149999.1 hypothetical protein LMH87_010768 [Akanthomyces muscarius]
MHKSEFSRHQLPNSKTPTPRKRLTTCKHDVNIDDGTIRETTARPDESNMILFSNFQLIPSSVAYPFRCPLSDPGAAKVLPFANPPMASTLCFTFTQRKSHRQCLLVRVQQLLKPR